ncbi:unnamed protein product [Sordaria macrospora k-hell]|uniref:WGS project CABT00000000 data, contig 2.2 n=1 Tax=Sordaria macrospora (strain ATCC MYA-333 / DSM 997 / K(L3346) / K-hell) TaxID=771870 RepID=F7VMW6_SORMK|nr:uncharacterized protein SMAC_00721 [Sordaria macrospora k-hell]KAH7630137.1 hypothetical protein B0T09DRAFT_142783 [Sordaria sp. MPI-SDFR-AT-0083]CCC06695.1 unnamed protein product [Sordaria macrospora k-hell]
MITAPLIPALSGPTISGNVVGLGGAGIVSGWIRDGMVAGRDNDIYWTGQTTRDNVSRHYNTAAITTPMVDHASVAGEADEERDGDGKPGDMTPLLSTPSTFLRLGIPTLSARGSLFLGFLQLLWQAIVTWSIRHRIRAILWLIAKAPFIILGDLWINLYAFVNYDPFANRDSSHASSPTGGLTKFQILFWDWTKWLRCDAKPWLVSVWEDVRGVFTRGTSFFSRNTKKKRKKWRIPGPTLQGIVADTKSQLEREEEEKAELERRRKEQEAAAADNGNGGSSRRKGGRGNGGRKQKKW